MTSRARPTRPEPRLLDDPRAIRALAHPARLAALDAFEGGNELTATQLAEAAGVSPSAMSYHLRELEKWGIVERVESSVDGRERPWRSYPGGFRTESLPTRAAVAATSTYTNHLMSKLMSELDTLWEKEPSQPAEWQAATGYSNMQTWLTAAETIELRDMVQDYLNERRDRSATDRPDGARRVRMVQIAILKDFDEDTSA